MTLVLSFVSGLFLNLFFRKNNLIIITSPKFSGNAEAIYSICVENKIRAYFITMTIKEYRLLKSKKVKVLFYFNPFHIAKLLRSHSILATHGVFFISIIKIFSNVKLTNIRHGVITIGANSSSKNKRKFINHSKRFDKYCFLSNKELQIVQNHLSYDFSNNFIFEFPHIEYIQTLSLNKQNLMKRMKLDNSTKYILIANTDVRKSIDTKIQSSQYTILNIYLF